jgi:hypothetical protein
VKFSSLTSFCTVSLQQNETENEADDLFCECMGRVGCGLMLVVVVRRSSLLPSRACRISPTTASCKVAVEGMVVILRITWAVHCTMQTSLDLFPPHLIGHGKKNDVI